MKKAISILLTAALLATALSACGGSSAAPAASSAKAESTKKEEAAPAKEEAPEEKAEEKAEEKVEEAAASAESTVEEAVAESAEEPEAVEEPAAAGSIIPEEPPKPADWPKKAITIICPYSAGGGSDLMSRALGEELSKQLGVAVNVEDKPGGSGAVGMAALAASKPDGYTLILTAMGACTLSPHTSDTGYTDESFIPICQVSASPTFLTVKSDSQYQDFESLLEAAKAAPGTINYGTSGAGGAHNVAVAALGLEVAGNSDLFNHIAFDGGSAACTALLGGHIDATASIYAEPSAYYESGDFKPVVVLAKERQDINPDVPCIEEFGYHTTGGTWYAIAAPAGTDMEICRYLEWLILSIMSTPEMQETFENLGNPVVLDNMEGITNTWKTDYVNNKEVLKAIGLIE